MLKNEKIAIVKDNCVAKKSNFLWINFECSDRRIGKARVYFSGRTLIINSIIIFPEFERNGYARKVIQLFKNHYEVIIADRVRFSAQQFWEKMGFVFDNCGNYFWKKGKESLPICNSIEVKRG